jgi:hypothetical protein
MYDSLAYVKHGGRTFRFGRLPRKPGHKMLFLSDYLAKKVELPAPPTSADWTTKVPSWPMMGNDQYGDCVEAGKGHMVMVFSAYGAGTLNTPSDQVIESTYFTETGGSDSGLDIPTSLDYWVQNPLAGDKLAAWAAVNPANHDEVKLAIALFGGVTLGVNLPDNCFDAINAGQPWTDTSGDPDPSMGHDIVLVAYDAGGPTCVTWGQLQKMSWDWFDKYTTECYVLIGADWETDPVPSGIALADLLSDYQELTGQGPPAPPPPVTPPVPAPAPTPTVVATLTVSQPLQPGTYDLEMDEPPAPAKSAAAHTDKAIPWSVILQLILQYGPQILAIIQQIINTIPNPAPAPAPTPVPSQAA